MSDSGVTIKQIADLVGHRTTIVTQKFHRHQLKPAISTGATAMNTIFGSKKSAWIGAGFRFGSRRPIRLLGVSSMS